ncbi:hypothetical protein JHK82_027463 [Glycine max]|nr:hypothetical protein JHK82_027463 [Glycine max]
MGTYCSYQKHLEDSTKSDNLAIMVSKQVSCVSVPVWDACSATPSSPCSISYHQSQLPSKVTMKHCMSNCKRLDPTGLAYTLMSYSSRPHILQLNVLGSDDIINAWRSQPWVGSLSGSLVPSYFFMVKFFQLDGSVASIMSGTKGFLKYCPNVPVDKECVSCLTLTLVALGILKVVNSASALTSVSLLGHYDRLRSLNRMEQLKLAKGPAKNNNAKPPSPRGSHASSIKKNKDGKHEERPQQGFHVFSPVEA